MRQDGKCSIMPLTTWLRHRQIFTKWLFFFNERKDSLDILGNVCLVNFRLFCEHGLCQRTLVQLLYLVIFKKDQYLKGKMYGLSSTCRAPPPISVSPQKEKTGSDPRLSCSSNAQGKAPTITVSIMRDGSHHGFSSSGRIYPRYVCYSMV